jgi:phthiocerol/phenolphthiocerol synthesis type-I polyketide synthase E
VEFAIVGAAIRLAGVNDIDEFRQRLIAGESAFRAVLPEDSLRAGVTADEMANPRYVAQASVIEHAERFDREFFGMTVGEAVSIDPQQRLLLTLAHEALESSGLDRHSLRVGTYVSTTISARYLQPAGTPGRATVDYQPLLGNDKDFGGVRIAHKLGLTGPAVSVQSACSSSLVAVHQACAAVAFGDADAAIAGGVSLSIPQLRGYMYQEGGVLSPTGQCRPFDADSNGTIKGNGGGLVVLRRLDDALAAGDDVLAVISGTAVNNDGSERMAFTAPSAKGQQCVISTALRRAGISPADVRYVEAHGTGTPLGDPIEYRALRRVYGSDNEPQSPECYLGSLKSSYGHLDAAAGITGLLKVMLVTRHGQVFPQSNFTRPNPLIELDSTRFDIPTTPRQFPTDAWAAVSAFGIGGTNAHALVRAPRCYERSTSRQPRQRQRVVVRVRARSSNSVARLCTRLADFLRSNADVSVADVAATLGRRTVSGAMWQLPARTIGELVDALSAVRPDDAHANTPFVADPHPPGRHMWLPPTPLDEVELPAVDTDTQQPASASIRGRSAGGAPVHALFMRFVAAELGSSVSADTDFFAAGGESIALVDIVGRLADQFDFAARFDDLDGLTTVGAMATVLERQAFAGRDEPDPLICFGPPGNVFWHPPAGGTNFCYAALHRVAPDLGINAFRVSLTKNQRSIQAIAQRNIALLGRRRRLTADLVLGGYSLGGNVGLEMAFQLQRCGIVARRLVLFDSRPPMAYQGANKSEGDFADAIEMVIRQAMPRNDANESRDLFARVISDDGSAAGVSFRDFTRLWRDNQRALVDYKPTGILECPITIFSSQDHALPAETEHLGLVDLPPTEWQRYTRQPLQIIGAPGNHYSLFVDPLSLKVLAESLPDVLRSDVR